MRRPLPSRGCGRRRGEVSAAGRRPSPPSRLSPARGEGALDRYRFGSAWMTMRAMSGFRSRTSRSRSSTRRCTLSTVAAGSSRQCATSTVPRSLRRTPHVVDVGEAVDRARRLLQRRDVALAERVRHLAHLDDLRLERLDVDLDLRLRGRTRGGSPPRGGRRSRAPRRAAARRPLPGRAPAPAGRSRCCTVMWCTSRRSRCATR